MLGQELSSFPANLPPTGFLSGTDSGIRPKIPPAELTMDEHPGLHEGKRWRPLYRLARKKDKTLDRRRRQERTLTPSDSTMDGIGILFIAAHTWRRVDLEKAFHISMTASRIRPLAWKPSQA
jgi:hypothetical protein